MIQLKCYVIKELLFSDESMDDSKIRDQSVKMRRPQGVTVFKQSHGG